MCTRALCLVAGLLCACAVSRPAVAEQFYKWTDEKGVVHYGSTPPPGVQSERKSVSGAAPTPVAPPAPVAATDSASDPASTAGAENDKRMAEYRKQRCDYARRQLDEAQKRRAPRVREVRGTERRTKMLGEQKAEQAQLQSDIGQYCKS